VSALPDAAPRSAGLRRVCLVLVACYASFGALGSAYAFYVSTLPVTTPDDFGASAPGWMTTIAAEGNLLVPLWAVLPAPLLICGAAHLRQTVPGRGAWPAAWASAVSIATVLEVEIWKGWAAPPESPGYYGPAIVDWHALDLAVAFVILGVTMAAVTGGAERSARHQPTARPHA
jgi:hypothetical protein